MGNLNLPFPHETLPTWVSPHTLVQNPNPQSRHHFPDWDNDLTPFGYTLDNHFSIPSSRPVNPHPAGYPCYIKIVYYDPRPYSFYYMTLPHSRRAWLDIQYTVTLAGFRVTYYIIITRSLESYMVGDTRIIGETRLKIIISNITYNESPDVQL